MMEKVIKMDYSVVLPAAGQGNRMQLGYNKLLYQKDGQMILAKTIQPFLNDPRCKQIIIVHAPSEEDIWETQLRPLMPSHQQLVLVCGKETRTGSVYAGLREVCERVVLIHDGARPFLKQEAINALLETLREEQAAILAVPCKDTIKRVTDMHIEATLDRSLLWQAQTPQAFHIELILQAYEKAIADHAMLTDDASAVEQYTNCSVKIVMGSYDNIKITTAEDLAFWK